MEVVPNDGDYSTGSEDSINLDVIIRWFQNHCLILSFVEGHDETLECSHAYFSIKCRDVVEPVDGLAASDKVDAGIR